MIKFINKYKQVFTIVGALSVLTVCYLQQKELSKLRKENFEFIQGGDITKSQTIDSLQHLADSLHWELLPTQIELGRHLVAFEIFAERNPKAADQYAEIISSETE
tara:strand:+ start:310 stop:624 length:315 start_codon:yes stop_codon:yes gene_type:complete